MKTLSIIIPVFNNEKTLKELYNRLIKVEQNLKHKILFEIIFVNDGSIDNSLDELKHIKIKNKKVKIINLVKNYGSNLASKTGIKYSKGDGHIILAADLQEEPELIYELAEHWFQGKKMIIAERSTRKDPLLSILFAKIFYFFLRLLVNKNYPKNGFDLFLIDRSITKHIINSDRDIYIPIYLFNLGFPFHKINYDRKIRLVGKSQWTFSKKFQAFLKIFSDNSYSISKIIFIFGILIILIAIIYSSILLYLSLFQGYRTGGFIIIFLYLTSMFGIVITMIGIISNQIFRILDRLSVKEETIVDDEDYQ